MNRLMPVLVPPIESGFKGMTSDRAERRPIEPLIDLTQLLKRCSPWLGPEKIAAELLTVWIHIFSLKQCLLLWSIPYLGELQGIIQTALPTPFSPERFSSNQVSLNQTASNIGHLRFPPLTSIPAAITLLNGLQSDNESWNWHTIQSPPDSGKSADDAGNPEIAIAFPMESNCVFNQEWLSLTGTVLSWAIRFQHELHTQKLESMAEYAAGAGHEINNPLGSIIGRASQLLKEETNPERKRALENIGAQAYRVRDMIGDTMSFARPPMPRLESLSLITVLQTVIGRFETEFEQQNLTCSTRASQDFSVNADRHQIEIVFAELLRNSQFAISSMPSSHGGKVEIELSAESRNNVPGVRIDVIDSGPGLDGEQRLHCFDPFYSGRQAGRGLGFGLSKCWQILRQHSGSIEILPQQSPVVIRLWLPVATNDQDFPAA